MHLWIRVSNEDFGQEKDLNIYQKLHVNSKAQIITLAHKNKCV
jgi:hypothetical protein